MDQSDAGCVGIFSRQDPSDAGRVGIFSQRTNRTQDTQVYSHDGPMCVTLGRATGMSGGRR
eukprot:3839537-Pyramimonas_sp.AAC.1